MPRTAGDTTSAKRKPGKKQVPCRRLEADAARELILAATEKRLVVVGPSGIRLQEVAADAGVSHPTVLHHFGSRDQLVKAVIARSLHAINTTLIEALRTSNGDEDRLEALLENVGVALERSGHARVVMWLALEGHHIDGSDVRLADVVDATHALRLTRTRRAKAPPYEDTARTVVLASLALIGGCVLGPILMENARVPTDEPGKRGFRRWLARLLIAHLDS